MAECLPGALLNSRSFARVDNAIPLPGSGDVPARVCRKHAAVHWAFRQHPRSLAELGCGGERIHIRRTRNVHVTAPPSELRKIM